MRKTLPALMVLSITVWFVSAATAQDEAQELAAAASSVERALAAQLPGWEHRVITPIEGSSDVILSQWESNGQIIRVSILLRPSKKAAEEGLKRFKSRFAERPTPPNGRRHGTLKGDEQNLGDEGFSWKDHNFYGTAFRRGKYEVFVNLVNPGLEETVTKEFARHIARALP